MVHEILGTINSKLNRYLVARIEKKLDCVILQIPGVLTRADYETGGKELLTTFIKNIADSNAFMLGQKAEEKGWKVQEKPTD